MHHRQIQRALVCAALLTCGCDKIEALANEAGKAQLPDELYVTAEGHSRLMAEVEKDFPALAGKVELLEYNYYASKNEAQASTDSSITMEFVRGDDKNRVASYSIHNDGMVMKNNLEISVGRAGKEKDGNRYEVFEPHIFTLADFDPGAVGPLCVQSVERFEKDAEAKGYCKSVTLKRGKRDKLTFDVTVKGIANDRLRRSYDYAADGVTALD